jgi:HlyD family type I secretion membrane fusion protein
MTSNRTAGKPSAAPPSRPPHWSKSVRTSLLGPSLVALLVAGGGLGGFVAWGSTAPLAGAVIAAGNVAANGENLVVQHLEGGIVKEIHVREGDTVVAGQPLLTLDPTQVESGLSRLRTTLATLRADEARLLAEQRGLDAITFPPELLAETLDPALKDVVETRTVEFNDRNSRHRSELRILEERLAGLDQEIAGTEAQREATRKQLGFIADELKDVEFLFKQGLARADRVFALRRSEADLEGKIGAFLASVGKARQTIAEVREQMEKLRHDRRTEAVGRLSDVRTKITDVYEQIRASESVLSRIVVRAPSDGIIVKLNVNTVGGVISPGQQVLELLPSGVDLVVDAKLQPNDIEAVKVGRPANVRLSALNQRTTPVVQAHVAFVSADKLTDRNTQQLYYRVRLTFDMTQLSPGERRVLSPGMPAEAFIATEERTMMRYLFRPIEDSIARAFREK